MDWRLQIAGLATAFVLDELPGYFGPIYTGNQTAFVSGWSNIVSVMQYTLFASLVLIMAGIAVPGSIGRTWAWILAITSVGLGTWTIWTGTGFAISHSYLAEDCCNRLLPAVTPVPGLLIIGLLVPTLSFASSLIWLFWNGRHNPRPATRIPP